jgi:hypothetical protein
VGFADNASGRAKRAIRLALNELGKRGVAMIRDSINVRVQHIGTLTIRSDPGEPPRREFSRLWRSIKYRVRARAKNVADLTIYQDSKIAPHGIWLENGTFKMDPRPFWEPARRVINRYIRSDFLRLARDYFRGNADDPVAGSESGGYDG